MLNLCDVEDALILNTNFQLISLKIYQKNLSTAEFILDTYFVTRRH